MHTKIVTLSVLQDWNCLSDFLSSFGISKSRQKKILNNKTYLSKSLKAKDIIKIPIDLFNHYMVSPKYDGPVVKKVDENDFLLALSKPVGIHSLPLQYLEQNNLLAYVRESENSAGIFSVNKDSYEKGLLYRLDYETSGLILLAKNKHFYEQFRHYLRKKKYYLAVVKGDIKNDFSYAHHIIYTGQKGAVGRVTNEANPNSHLEGKKIIFNANLDRSLVLIKLDEGKRHQIRLQLSHEGSPIVGDPLYGGQKAERMYLHAFCYQFTYENSEYKFIDENISHLKVIFDTDRALKMIHHALLSF